MVASEFARQYSDKIISISVHPGLIKSELARHMNTTFANFFVRLLLSKLYFYNSTDQLPSLRTSTSPMIHTTVLFANSTQAARLRPLLLVASSSFHGPELAGCQRTVITSSLVGSCGIGARHKLQGGSQSTLKFCFLIVYLP
jgi:hypothetical protein